MKRLCFTFMIYIVLQLMFISLCAQDNTPQIVRTLLYRLEKKDSCMVLDMNIDLSKISLVSDCTVYLYPWLRTSSDSLRLAPVMLNGPQSDLMYRRRKALGKRNKEEKWTPYVVLREGDHPLPCINYYRTDIPYQTWMDGASVVLKSESYNIDARLKPFQMETEIIPPKVVIRKDTVIRHDTIQVEKPVDCFLTIPQKEETYFSKQQYGSNKLTNKKREKNNHNS